jgi:hypothetical protein
MYDNLFCNQGRELRGLIKAENDFYKYELKIKEKEAPFGKFLPAMEEIRDFTGPDFINLEYFVKMYVEMIDFELDEDIIWPYQWPFNI